VGVTLMNLWLEHKQIASSIQFEECEDSIIRQFDSSRQYSVQSLYAVINDRRVR
jgi:hypothetical protein